jgi:hypothetical protein
MIISIRKSSVDSIENCWNRLSRVLMKSKLPLKLFLLQRLGVYQSCVERKWSSSPQAVTILNVLTVYM